MNITIIGAGNTGFAAAAHLASLGHTITVYTRTESKARALSHGPLIASGCLEGSFAIRGTTDLSQALCEADIVMVLTWANAHHAVAEALAAHAGHPITVLICNGNWGAYETYDVFSRHAAMQGSVIAETAGMPYVAHWSFDDDSQISVDVIGIKTATQIAVAETESCNTAQGAAVQSLLSFMADSYGRVEIAPSVFSTSLSAPNPIIHAPLCLLNMAQIEQGIDFHMLVSGFTDRTAHLVKGIDDERAALAAALRADYEHIVDQLNGFWGTRYATLPEVFRSNSVYSSLLGPTDPFHRFIQEDIPYGIAPLVSLGRALQVPTPTCEALLVIYRQYFDDAFAGPTFDADIIAALQAAKFSDRLLDGEKK